MVSAGGCNRHRAQCADQAARKRVFDDPQLPAVVAAADYCVILQLC